METRVSCRSRLDKVQSWPSLCRADIIRKSRVFLFLSTCSLPPITFTLASTPQSALTTHSPPTVHTTDRQTDVVPVGDCHHARRIRPDLPDHGGRRSLYRPAFRLHTTGDRIVSTARRHASNATRSSIQYPVPEASDITAEDILSSFKTLQRFHFFVNSLVWYQLTCTSYCCMANHMDIKK